MRKTDVGLIGLHVVSACAGILVYASPSTAGVALPYCVSVSVLAFFLSLLQKRDNALFLSRTLFIGVIGYFPIIVKLSDQTALFSLIEQRTQGLEITIKIYALTSLALLGSEIGLAMGRGAGRRPMSQSDVADRFNDRVLFFGCAFAVFWAAYVTAGSAPSVLAASYATEATGQTLGNTQAIGIIALLGMALALARGRIPGGWAVFAFLAVYFLGWAMLLRGLRQDVVTALLGLYIVGSIARRRSPAVSGRVFLVALIVVLASEVWGVLRVTLSVGGTGVLESLKSIVTYATQTGAYHVSTVSAIANTFSSTIFLVDGGEVGLAYGKTILEFIPRTPPAFLSPNRPADYALMFAQHGLTSLGGFYELAEGYMNFGALGVFLLPMCLSYLIAKAYCGAWRHQTTWRYFVLFGFLGMWLRGTWYQIFAFYKSAITAVIMFGGLLLLSKLLVEVTRAVPMRSTAIDPRPPVPQQ